MSPWILLAFGIGGLLLLVGGSGGGGGGGWLGTPVEVTGTPRVTPNGHYGAHRRGPPVHKHQGIDLRARPGSRVLAVGDGLIVKTKPGLGGIVRKLVLDEPAAWTLVAPRKVHAVVYADLGKPLVEPGAKVRRGDPVALVWNRGFVHFAVKERKGGREVFFDPAEAGFAYERSRPAVA